MKRLTFAEATELLTARIIAQTADDSEADEAVDPVEARKAATLALRAAVSFRISAESVATALEAFIASDWPDGGVEAAPTASAERIAALDYALYAIGRRDPAPGSIALDRDIPTLKSMLAEERGDHKS